MSTEIDIKQINIEDIKPYPNNPRKNAKAVEKVAESIKQFGFQQPIVVDKDMTIIVGHTRYQAAIYLDMDKVPVIEMTETDPVKIKAYRIADNKTNELAEWDMDLLYDELKDIEEQIGDIDITGFNSRDMKDMDAKKNHANEGYKSLSERYLVNPFTILDARQGEWSARKKTWLKLGIQSEVGRDAGLLYEEGGFGSLEGKTTSIFDPHLCEVLYTWFSNESHHILDPFAGGSVRGVVASMLGREYTGIDLRPEQIDANNKQWEDIKQVGYPLKGYNHKADPIWIPGDSVKMLDDIEDESKDLIFTCPPYADLEVYSQDEADISNMNYEDFNQFYGEILSKSVNKLKDNRFAVVVIGEARNKQGNYYNLIGDTITHMKNAGCHLYNELIYITPGGTLPILAGRPFKATRKVGKHHQNALVFLKGDVVEHHEKALVFVKGNGKDAADHAGRIEIDHVQLLTEVE
jgi:DNA modification methylase